MKEPEIKILPQTLELFNMFYHDFSYAGELRIHLIDKIVIGGNQCTLFLVLAKDAGKFSDSINNSYYEFYLEFSTKIPNGRHPIRKPLYFKNFHEQYEPIMDAETFRDIIENCLDKEVFKNLCLDSFGTILHLIIEDPNKEKSIDLESSPSVSSLKNHDLLTTLNNVANKDFNSNLFDPAVLT